MNRAQDLTALAARLDAEGQAGAARSCYVAALASAADHAPALHGLGALLSRDGQTAAALTVYRQLVACHPDDVAAHVGLGQALLLAGDADAARAHFENALAWQADLAEAHQGLGNIYSARGDADGAAHHWRLGFGQRVFNAWAYRGRAAPIRVLLLISVTGGNMRARFLLDDTVFSVISVAMEFVTGACVLPPHDLVVNAVSDADLCGVALQAACALVARTDAPVINHPAQVMRTGRAANALRLQRLEDVLCPRIETFTRAALLSADAAALLGRAKFRFPVLLRSPGFHTGLHFHYVDKAADLAGVVASLPGEAMLAIQYIDARGRDGYARKGRVMMIGGQLYPLHLAISVDWKVHYFTSCMQQSVTHRAEEARFLEDMAGFVGAAGMRALDAIAGELGLDYAGIDFALSEHGQIIVFEANAAMVILPPPAGAVWDYRREAAARALRAARLLIRQRARLENAAQAVAAGGL